MKKGFTLTEVLITLGIVGAISVLTLPNLITSHHDKQFVAQMQRTYNIIRNSMVQYIADEYADDINGTSLNGSIGDEGKNFLNRKYFGITKDCGLLQAEPYAEDSGYDCIGDNYTLSDRTTTDIGNEFFYCVILKTGASVCLSPIQEGRAIFLDVNGKSKPNMFGRDAFLLQYDDNGRIVDKDSDECETSKGKYGCFGKIQRNGWTIK